MVSSSSSACPRGQVAIPKLLVSSCDIQECSKVCDLLSLVMSSRHYKKVVLKLQKEKVNLMETWVRFWGRRMATAARLAEVCQFAWHNSYPGKLVLLLLLCTIFSVFSLPMIFSNLHSCFFFQKFLKVLFPLCSLHPGHS